MQNYNFNNIKQQQIIPCNQEDLKSIGKIDFISDSFEEDNEDYSKWDSNPTNKKEQNNE